MALISSKQINGSKTISFKVGYQPDFDLAIVTQLLAELGLVTTSLLQVFSEQFYKGNLFEDCLADIRKDKNLFTQNLKTAKTTGSVIITAEISASIINLLTEFFASDIGRELIKRAEDAGYQLRSKVNNSIRGIILNTVEAGKDMYSGTGKIISGAWDGFTSPVGSGRFTDGWRTASEGALRASKGYFKANVQTPADFLLTNFLGHTSFFQTWFGLESVGRLLDPTEEQALKNIFGQSIVYEAIRIKTGYAGLLNAGKNNGWTFTNNTRAITIGNTIYMKNASFNSAAQSDWMSTLVHETVHVWQHQNGGTDYMLEAICAQEIFKGYSYETDVLNNKKSWGMLNPEQQGSLIQDAYTTGFLQSGIPNGQWIAKDTGIHRTDLEQYFISQNILGKLRSGQGAT